MLSMSVGDIRAGRITFHSWANLKNEWHEQFLPGNMAWFARLALKKLKHIDMVHDYDKDFTLLILDI